MSIVTVKNKYQVVIPQSVRDQVAVKVGDLFEAAVERGKITLTPKSLVDRAIAEGLEDVRKGRVYGPFDTHKAMVAFLHDAVKKSGSRKSRNSKA
jgi:AbrB family looped-hinge helix DNA binding protein